MFRVLGGGRKWIVGGGGLVGMRLLGVVGVAGRGSRRRVCGCEDRGIAKLVGNPFALRHSKEMHQGAAVESLFGVR